MDLNDRQQTVVRCAINSELREWERLAETYKPWPYAEGRAKEYRELKDLFLQGDISVSTAAELVKPLPQVTFVLGEGRDA